MAREAIPNDLWSGGAWHEAVYQGLALANLQEEALDVLEKVAAWFERNEPQSILISEIRKVKRRALMTPEQLYKDLIEDSTVREQLFRDVGIEPSSSDDYDE